MDLWPELHNEYYEKELSFLEVFSTFGRIFICLQLLKIKKREKKVKTL